MSNGRVLKIYIDESGGLDAATDDDTLFVLSLVAVEETPTLVISQADLDYLLTTIGYTDMIHTAPLVRWGTRATTSNFLGHATFRARYRRPKSFIHYQQVRSCGCKRGQEFTIGRNRSRLKR